MENQKKRLLSPGGAVYILPNMLTATNLFFGYYSIVKSMQGQYSQAGLAILLAAIFDVLDGRVARLTNGTSAFGVQFDSLCDLVSFGVAPAILMFKYALAGLGRVGWIVCFIFLACGALRLARFNVQSSIGSKKTSDFTGLPIPMPAGFVACFVLFVASGSEIDEPMYWVVAQFYSIFSYELVRQIFFLVFAPLLAFLMVSNFAYRSMKSFKISSIKVFRLLAVLVAAVGLVAFNPPLVGFLFFFCYALSGPFEWIVGWKKVSEEDDTIFTPLEEDELFAADDMKEENEKR